MATNSADYARQHQLRIDAEAALVQPLMSPPLPVAAGAEALTVIHKLAASPASASDALKLLHELQVHQIELDLQNREMLAARQEMREALEKHAHFRELSPVGALSVDFSGKVVDGNQTAAEQLGVTPTALVGLSLGSVLSEGNRSELLQMLARLKSGPAKASCLVQIRRGDGSLHSLQILGRAHPGGVLAILGLVDLAGPKHEPPAD